MTVQVKVVKERYTGNPSLMAHHSHALSQEASTMMEMLNRWGMVAAEDDGEDSSGRAKIKLSTPEALVRRACEMTERAYAICEEKGWLTKTPTLEEMEEMVKEEL